MGNVIYTSGTAGAMCNVAVAVLLHYVDHPVIKYVPFQLHKAPDHATHQKPNVFFKLTGEISKRSKKLFNMKSCEYAQPTEG